LKGKAEPDRPSEGIGSFSEQICTSASINIQRVEFCAVDCALLSEGYGNCARVKDVMTALEHCFLLELRSRLNFATMLAIYKSGFTRIPVYEGARSNIMGILYVKDLILVDPDDEAELSAVLGFRCAGLKCC
jgi:Mg2+/Co2+ transporter CorC